MNKRQRGRGRRPHNNNNPNRSLDSNGPDVKVRGSAQTIYDKYITLARDARTSGARVKSENYLQHAEHYLRLVQEQQAKAQAHAEQQQARQQNQQKNAQKNGENNDTDAAKGHQNDRSRKGSRRRPQNESVKADNANGEDQKQGDAKHSKPVTNSENVAETEKAEKPKPRTRRTKKPQTPDVSEATTDRPAAAE